MNERTEVIAFLLARCEQKDATIQQLAKANEDLTKRLAEGTSVQAQPAQA